MVGIAIVVLLVFLVGSRSTTFDRFVKKLGNVNEVDLLGLPTIQAPRLDASQLLPPMSKELEWWCGVFRETVMSSDGKISDEMEDFLSGSYERKILANARLEAEKEKANILKEACEERDRIASLAKKYDCTNTELAEMLFVAIAIEFRKVGILNDKGDSWMRLSDFDKGRWYVFARVMRNMMVETET